MNIFSKQILFTQEYEIYKPGQVIINDSGTFELLQDGMYSLCCVGGKGGSCSLSWRQDITSGSQKLQYNSYGTLTGGNGGKFDGWIFLPKGIYTAFKGTSGSYNSAYHVTVSTSVRGGSGTASYLRNSNGTNLIYCSTGSSGSAHVTYNPNDGNYTSKTSVSYGASDGSAGSVTIDSSAETYNVTIGNDSSPQFTLTYLGTKKAVFGGESFLRPSLTTNGTLGGTSFAVSAGSNNTNAYYAVDSNVSSIWYADTKTATFTFYNPNPINVTKLSALCRDYYAYIANAISVEGSDDNSSWTAITSNSSLSSATMTVDLTNNDFYKYYRLTITATSQASLADLQITATVQTS